MKVILIILIISLLRWQKIMYNEYLKNKKVILVGSAERLLFYNLGSYIDSFDIIVRVNRAIAIKEFFNQIGSKTNVLYHCFNPDMEEIKNESFLEIVKDIRDLKFIVPTFPNTGDYPFEHPIDKWKKLIEENTDCKMEIYKNELWLDLKNQIGTLPLGTTINFEKSAPNNKKRSV